MNLELFDIGDHWQGEGRDPLDRYYTPEWATRALVEHLRGQLEPGVWIWEPCAGRGHIANVLRETGAWVVATDIKRHESILGKNFLTGEPPRNLDWIITNPPYTTPTCKASDFVRRALELCGRVAMLLPGTFLEGTSDRIDILENTPPSTILNLGRVSFIVPGRKLASPPGWSGWFIWDESKRSGSTELIYYKGKR